MRQGKINEIRRRKEKERRENDGNSYDAYGRKIIMIKRCGIVLPYVVDDSDSDCEASETCETSNSSSYY